MFSEIIWIEDIEFGYADFLGGQSMRSGQLIIDNGNFDSKISYLFNLIILLSHRNHFNFLYYL